MTRSFPEMVREQWMSQRYVCVGLDTDVGKLPASLMPGMADGQRVLGFNRAIIDATSDIAAVYKPNIAFYEALGSQGFDVLRGTVHHIHDVAPDVPVIVDAKRGDIGNTNLGYAHAIFDEIGADAMTVSPYLGSESLAPLLDRAERGIFVLVRTSNPGAGEFQDLVLDTGRPLYLHIAEAVQEHWNTRGNCGLVAGATYPDELAHIRSVAPGLPILIPGIGTQGGDLERSILAAWSAPSGSFLINASRSILYASGGNDFASAARTATVELHDKVQTIVNSRGR